LATINDTILFHTYFCQDNSSEFSPIMPDEFGEHLTPEDHLSKIMLVVLFFNLAHSFSEGFRSGDWDGHGRSFILCSVTHFCVDFVCCTDGRSNHGPF